MRTTQDITFGVTGQTLICDATEGRASSVTRVDVFGWRMGDLETPWFTPTGTVETNPNTTLDSAAGVSESDPRNIPLTATTGALVDRRYLVTGASNLTEWIEVADVTSADSVRARHPLHNNYASGALFQSTRMTAPIDASFVADLNRIDPSPGANPMYRVRWVYVVAGVSYVADTYFNLIRYVGRHGVLPQDVDDVSPGWLDRLPIDHRRDQGRRLIDEAHVAVKVDLAEIDVDDATIANAEIIDELTRYKASGDLAAYTTRRDSLVRLVQREPVRNTAGAARPGKSIGLSRR